MLPHHLQQALAVIRVIQSVFGGECTGAALGGTEVTYTPSGKLYGRAYQNDRCGPVEEDVGSAGSLTLVLQAVLPCVLLYDSRAEEKLASNITLIGGTNVSFSPPVEHFMFVLLPLLSRMGMPVTAQLLRRGFYPRGGGKVRLSCASVSSSTGLRPLTLTSQGVFTRAQVFVYSSPEKFNDGDESDSMSALVDAVSQLKNDLHGSISKLLSKIDNTVEDFPIEFDNVDESFSLLSGDGKKGEKVEISQHCHRKKQKSSHGRRFHSKKVAITLGAVVCLHTSTGCIIYADSMMNERDHNKFNVARSSAAVDDLTSTIISRLEHCVLSGACIDEHSADQLLLYMAMAPGVSEMLCAPVCSTDSSQHIEAAVDVITQFTGRQFVVEIQQETSCRLIRCEGYELQDC